MRAIVDFSLKQNAEESFCLSFQRQPLLFRTSGRVLDGQFECQAGYLLLISADIPHEELLEITLFCRDLRPLDQIDLWHPNTAGIFQCLEHHQTDELDFSFFQGDRWNLKVLVRPTRQLTLPPIGAHWSPTRMLHKSYLRLRKSIPGVV